MRTTTLRPSGLGGWVSTLRDRPEVIARYGRNGLQHHLIGPLNAWRRPGGFAIFHVGRCGSTVLTDLLGQHPDVHNDGETYVRVLEQAKASGRTPADVGGDPADYIQRRLRRAGAKWFMFDLKFDHVGRLDGTMQQYVDDLERIGVDRFVSLRRRNLLRKFVSQRMAVERGAYHSTDAAARERIQVHLDLHELSVDGVIAPINEHLDRITGQYDDFERITAGRAVLHLDYEHDLLADPLIGHDKVADHVGLRPHTPSVRMQKLNPFPLEEIVANYGEVAAALRGTAHEWMLTAAG